MKRSHGESTHLEAMVVESARLFSLQQWGLLEPSSFLYDCLVAFFIWSPRNEIVPIEQSATFFFLFDSSAVFASFFLSNHHFFMEIDYHKMQTMNS